MEVLRWNVARTCLGLLILSVCLNLYGLGWDQYLNGRDRHPGKYLAYNYIDSGLASVNLSKVSVKKAWMSRVSVSQENRQLMPVTLSGSSSAKRLGDAVPQGPR